MMRWTLLGLLCLLLVLARAWEEGEVCHEGFRCPQRPDGTDGRFCCGTCLAPYCCDSTEDRLDRDQCLNVWRTLGLFARSLMTQGGRATLPFQQDLRTSPASHPQTQGVTSEAKDDPQGVPWSQKMPTSVLVGGIVCGLMLILVLLLVICDCCIQGLAPFPYHRPGDAYPQVPAAAGSSESGPSDSPPPSPPRRAFETPNRVAPSNPPAASRGKDEAASGSQIPSLAIRGAEEAAAQASTAPAPTPDTSPPGELAVAEEVAPVQGAAVGGENPPEQGTDGIGGKATAEVDPAGGGERASPGEMSA